MPKRTYQPSKIKKIRRHGFRRRIKSFKGRLVLKKRRIRGREKIAL